MTTQDKRESVRHRTLLSGLIVFEAGARSLGCTIRDLSATGAKIELSGPEPMPRLVWLIEVRSGLAHECRIVWTDDRRHGLHFLSSLDLPSSTNPETVAQRRLWTAYGPR